MKSGKADTGIPAGKLSVRKEDGGAPTNIDDFVSGRVGTALFLEDAA